MPQVLIVDDEADIREALAQIVEADGLEAVEAVDGAAALEIVKRRMPDVILLDIHMPNVDGMEFLKSMRADASLTQPSVIMVTAKGAPDDQYAAMKLGVVDYISKPWAPGEIELRIKWALKSGSTVPAVPWELSDAASVFREDQLEHTDGEAEPDLGYGESVDWSPLTLPEDSETDVVTPEEGGWLETKDGRVRVTLPAGAVSRAMALSASPADVDGELNPTSLRLRLGDEATDLTFSDRTGSPISGARLDRPMEISIRLDQHATEDVDDLSGIHVQELDNRTREWSDLPARVDLQKGIATVDKLEFHRLAQQKEGTVLVISDVESERESLCEILDSAGYGILIEPDLDKIIATIIGERPDVMLLDIAVHRKLKSRS